MYDYRGSTIALTGDNGLITDRMEYSLYGTMTYHAGASDTPFLFAGRYGVQSDPDGLLYMQSRYYSPFLCRFINPDPTGFKGGMNFYAYANGNPASMIDPFGLDAAPIVTANGDNITYQPAPDNSLEAVLNYTPPVEDSLLSPDVGQTETSASLYHYETVSTGLGISGMLQSGVQYGSGAASIGVNNVTGEISFYSHFYGNQYSSAIMVSDIADNLGPYGFAAGVVNDTVGVYQGNVSPTKWGVNAAFAYIGLRGGVPGAIIAGSYFLGDQTVNYLNNNPNGAGYEDFLDGLYGTDPEDGGAGDP